MQRLNLQVLNGGGRLVAGSSQFLTVLLTDTGGVLTSDVPTVGTPLPLGSPATVSITLSTPSGQLRVNAAPMTADATTAGYFNFTYQSTAIDEQGLWFASFTANDGAGNVANFPSRPIFTVTGQ